VQSGLASDFRRGGWFASLVGKLALGGMDQRLNIQGYTVQAVPGSPLVVAPGGVLAQRTNIGQFSHGEFVVIPEFTLNAGYELNAHVRAFVGYNFLLVSSVVRPGDQVDAVDGRQIRNLNRFDPTAVARRPAVFFKGTDLWAQGLNFGLEIRY
jgi:cobyric acid synthase